MFRASEQELWEGNPGGHSQLSAVARLMNLKVEFHFSKRLYDELYKFLSEKGCMLFRNDDVGLTSCKVYGHPRFKKQGRGSNKRKTNIPYTKMHYFPLTPRLQRLYASHATTNHMRWHGEHEWEEDGIMRHCSDSLAWKHFNEEDLLFASEVRNVRATIFFLASDSDIVQFTTRHVHERRIHVLDGDHSGPKNPKDKLEVGANTYDISTKQNFQMRAAFIWTVSYFPAYSMLSGWSTAGKLACPHCMDDSDAFSLTTGRKTSWFDNHRKFLPPDHSFRRNKKWFRNGKVVLGINPDMLSSSEILDQIEYLGLKKSNRVMNVSGKTKDNTKSREDLKEFCCRPELHKDENSGKYPKASSTLYKKGKEELCNWRLIPIVFRELLPANVWQVLTELSLFFKSLTSTVIRREEMIRLEQEIPIILCKLERIFPPSFFDSMEHLPIHLPHEARIAGPVQYRWMYPFERYLRRLKNNVANKSQVEGSITNAYLVEETASFFAHYFKPAIHTRHKRVSHNDDGGVDIIYEDELRFSNPNISSIEVELKLENDFAKWFEKYAHKELSNITNPIMQDFAKVPLHKAKCYSGYYVNGYKFHTEEHGSSRLTMNSGVCIRGSNSSTDEFDYYGKLVETLELDYPASPIKKIVLFKCSWFDPTPRLGTRVHPQLKLVDVNCRRVFNKYEPFIMAFQEEQVHYLRYPTSMRSDWLAVCKIKPRFVVEIPDRSNISVSPTVLAYQEDSIEHHEVHSQVDKQTLTMTTMMGKRRRTRMRRRRRMINNINSDLRMVKASSLSPNLQGFYVRLKKHLKQLAIDSHSKNLAFGGI
ncbi:uncharacterized protein LOC126661659 [Mercurialis annua]|uniref:uncharacterized protein LOC126661659 n=1 Tax=Mercurialis annua TaxID=3986 RepID=UPI00215FF16D|nr:uncharacterized protein LOC126661659 [Mercurialis annua]